VRACYAAIDLQRAMRRLTETLRQSHGVAIQARVGLNSGEVVVRTIANDFHMDYTAVGQTTHLAARMEQFAIPGTTLLTADTLRLAEGYVEVKPLGAIRSRGCRSRWRPHRDGLRLRALSKLGWTVLVLFLGFRVAGLLRWL
jgi:class 3 adenylate cyclase